MTPLPGQPDIQATIGDVDSAQVAVGSGNAQSGTVGRREAPAGDAERGELRILLAGLARQVDAEAPPERRAGAHERIGELEDALTAATPDLTTVEYVTRWFSKHLPHLAGAVLAVLVNPVVGAVVAAGGDGLIGELRRRVGIDPS
jgi:hypothetical protein